MQSYTNHVCKMYPISGKFLYDDQFIVTGSEDNSAYLYEAISGKVARKVEFACPVTHTEPTAAHDLSFYVVLYRNQRLGLVDVSGEEVQAELPSVEEQHRENVKMAMQTTLWETSNQIFQHLRVIGRYNMVGYGNLLEALQSTAQSDEGSRRLLEEIQSKCDQKLAESYMKLPEILHLQRESGGAVQKDGSREGSLPVVRVESSTSEPWRSYLPRQS